MQICIHICAYRFKHAVLCTPVYMHICEYTNINENTCQDIYEAFYMPFSTHKLRNHTPAAHEPFDCRELSICGSLSIFTDITCYTFIDIIEASPEWPGKV